MRQRDSGVGAGEARITGNIDGAGLQIVVDPDKGRCVVSTSEFAIGQTVVVGDVERIVPTRTTHSFQVGWDSHVDLTTPARDINHSCDPNTGIRDNDRGGFDFIALREIGPDEEITWDYETSEYVSIAVSRCLCGATGCRSVIRGYRYRSADPSWQPSHLAGYLSEPAPESSDSVLAALQPVEAGAQAPRQGR
ncbi:SET domain [Actinoalloteichus hymeniacidonis]|uniref:SET domain n=1 Tax=Actinoalloteichus hymeniacidonis TaxID=340345 RepID=A0AAC9MX33_9PSEU|nr:SET domain [Actinoalloteichus hymeniacidonis]